jgi:H+/Cl- antiporter ClcA
VLATGVGAGVAGAGLTLLLHLVQHLAYGYSDEPFVLGSQQASALRRVLAMTAGGALVGSGWWALRRWTHGPISVTAAVRGQALRPRVPSSTADAVLQITAVGCGASLGREGAPRQVAGALAGWLADRAGLTPARKRTLIACGAGAGLAAVYNVPLAGTLFALEALLASTAPADVVPAVLTSAIATAVAWPVVGNRPTYEVPPFTTSSTLLVGSIVLGPVAAAVGWGFLRLTTAARVHAPTGWRLPLTTTVVFAALGGAAVAYPLILGNGRGPAGLAFTGTLAVPLLAVLLVLKPVATAACLRSGAVGGLLTPAVATGAVLGALAGRAWILWWPGSPIGAFAVVGAAAVLATTQRAPLTATALAVEFTHSGFPLLVPVLLAVGIATAVSRLLPLHAHQDRHSTDGQAGRARSDRPR